MRDLIKAGCVALVLSLSLAAPAAAGPFEDGMAAFERRDYATALRLFRPLANQGNAAAQSYLGTMYRYGWGVPEDYAEAVKWFRKAAEQGFANAQSNLGSMYLFGVGVPQDYAEALTWHLKAAELGHPGAQQRLGSMYEAGQGMPQDYVQAHKWFNLAAARFTAAQTEFREQAAKNRDRVAAKMTAVQIAEAQRLAREWKPK